MSTPSTLFLLLAALAAPGAATAASLRIVGSASSSEAGPLPGGEYDVTSATGPLVEGRQVDGGGLIGSAGYASGQAISVADYGLLGVQSGGEANGPRPRGQGFLGEISGGGLAEARWSDRFTIMPALPALLFTGGTLSYAIGVSGSGGGTLAGPPGASGLGAAASYLASASLGTCPTCSTFVSGNWDTNASGNIVFTGDPPPAALAATVPFTFGLPIAMEVLLASTAGGAVLFEGTKAEGFANMIGTLRWGGIGEVRDAQGALLEGWSLTSDSGVDWRVANTQEHPPIPEPGTAALVWLGLGALASHGFVRAFHARMRGNMSSGWPS